MTADECRLGFLYRGEVLWLKCWFFFYVIHFDKYEKSYGFFISIIIFNMNTFSLWYCLKCVYFSTNNKQS